MNKLLEMADELIRDGELPFAVERDDKRLNAQLSSGRSQRVLLRRSGDEYKMISTVVRSDHVEQSPTARADLLRRIWAKNAATELVSFGIDSKDRVVGMCRHPAATLDLAELRHYVVALVQECDRFEWVLSGEDRN